MPHRIDKKFWFISIVVFSIGVFLIDNMESQNHISEEDSSIVLIDEEILMDKVESEPGTMCVLYYMPQSPDYSKMVSNLAEVKDSDYGDIPMYKLNVEEYPEPFFSQNLAGTPVVVFYKDGKETARAMGKVSARNIKHILKRLI